MWFRDKGKFTETAEVLAQAKGLTIAKEALKDNPFFKDEDGHWQLKFDELIFKNGKHVILRYKGEDMYEMPIGVIPEDGTLNLSGIAGTMEVHLTFE